MTYPAAVFAACPEAGHLPVASPPGIPESCFPSRCPVQHFPQHGFPTTPNPTTRGPQSCVLQLHVVLSLAGRMGLFSRFVPSGGALLQLIGNDYSCICCSYILQSFLQALAINCTSSQIPVIVNNFYLNSAWSNYWVFSFSSRPSGLKQLVILFQDSF